MVTTYDNGLYGEQPLSKVILWLKNYGLNEEVRDKNVIIMVDVHGERMGGQWEMWAMEI